MVLNSKVSYTVEEIKDQMFKQVAKNPTSFNTVISHPNTHRDQKVRLEISNRRNSHQLQTDEALSVDKLTK